MNIFDIFLNILEQVANFINDVFEVVNPDPFPEIIDSMVISANDPFVTAWAYINNFVDVGSILIVFQAWLTMFATAWAIMLLWRWVKAR